MQVLGGKQCRSSDGGVQPGHCCYCCRCRCRRCCSGSNEWHPFVAAAACVNKQHLQTATCRAAAHLPTVLLRCMCMQSLSTHKGTQSKVPALLSCVHQPDRTPECTASAMWLVPGTRTCTTQRVPRGRWNSSEKQGSRVLLAAANVSDYTLLI